VSRPPQPRDDSTVDRRHLLRLAGRSALGFGALSVLAACGDGARTSAPAPTRAARAPASTSSASAVTASTQDGEPTASWWERGNFAPVTAETTAHALPVEGALPPELDGLYVRNGSNPRSPAGHWFVGEGMVHGVRLRGGRAEWYRNRFVRTPVYEQGELPPGPPGYANGYANVSVVHGPADRLLCLGEIGQPYELDPSDLSTIGLFDFAGGGALGPNVTAHPKIDPATGRMHFFGYGLLEPPFLVSYTAAPDGTLERVEPIGVGASTMIHDFAVTDRDAIFWEFPVLFDLDLAIGGEAMPFRWEPSYGSRIGVLALEGSGADVRWVEIDNGFVFHGLNAFRRGDEIVVDVCRLDSVFDDAPFGTQASHLHRWTIRDTGTQLTFRSERLDDAQLDFPFVDRRFVGRPNALGFFAEFEHLDGAPIATSLVRRDDRTGAIERWDGAGLQLGEPLLVPAGDGEGEGWLLSFAHDQASGLAGLVVLDATNVRAGPVATVHLPVRVPFGFHGTWVPGDPT
jgi:carotenoid cleavage dioxygenase-like enzyme